MSWMDVLMPVILRSRPTLPHGAARSRSADHSDAIIQLYSGCTARQGEDNRMLHNSSSLASHHCALTHLQVN